MKFTKLIATLGTVAVLSLTGATVASASTTVARPLQSKQQVE